MTSFLMDFDGGKATLIPGSTQQEGGADCHVEVLDPVHDQVVLDDGEEASTGCGAMWHRELKETLLKVVVALLQWG
ncbi:uncharacterized protein A4U43_C03F21240 [Asparagus officinalis]|uniref:Uncharacterized protein n=1 Tax=Asparagus officinalis TaxID=4686 RepID=A0A5P1FDN4_ASPOF|nr:uncharacterized protein A4U43_C03F21240 [Asparagus officinalis]